MQIPAIEKLGREAVIEEMVSTNFSGDREAAANTVRQWHKRSRGGVSALGQRMIRGLAERKGIALTIDDFDLREDEVAA